MKEGPTLPPEYAVAKILTVVMFRGFNKVVNQNVLKCKRQVRLPCIHQVPLCLQCSQFYLDKAMLGYSEFIHDNVGMV